MTLYKKTPLYRKIADPVTRTFLHHIWLRLNNSRYKYGFMGVITGDPGHGKTETAGLASYLLSNNDFNFEDNYALSGKKFLKLITSGDLKKGDWVVWDEPGISFSARQWHSMSNILIGQAMQEIRFKQLGVWLVVPDLSFIDVIGRKLLHYFTEAARYMDHPVRWRVHKIQINRTNGDIIFPYPRVMSEGICYRVKEIMLTERLPKKLVKQYEDISEEWKNKVLVRNLKEVEKIEMSELGDLKFDYFETVEIVQKDPEKYQVNKKYNAVLIGNELKIPHYRAKQVSTFLNQKAIEEKKYGKTLL